MRIPDAVSGAAEMQMIQLQNYQQWDASLQADPWLFLGKSSEPPLHLSPPAEIRAENIIPYCLGLHFLPALQQGNGAGAAGVAAPLPGHLLAGIPGASSARKDKHDPRHDPGGLSHLPGGFVPTPAGLGRRRGAAAAIFSLFS